MKVTRPSGRVGSPHILPRSATRVEGGTTTARRWGAEEATDRTDQQRAPVWADGDIIWVVELRSVPHAISAALYAAAREGRHLSRRHLHPPDLVVAEVCHKQSATVWADGDAMWVIELRRAAHAISVAILAAACKGGHRASRRLHL